MDAGQATAKMIEAVRSRPWGLAAATIADGGTAIAFDEGADRLCETSLFEIGSITKTITGLLLAESVVRGELSLETTVGDVLGVDAGNCGEVTLLDLATQRSGLPRLPPNLDPENIDPLDPYAAYTEARLLESLAMVEAPQAGDHLYSNFGFMLLGFAVGRAASNTFAELAQSRIFQPLGMSTAGCPPPEHERIPVYSGAAAVPWWSSPLPGPGGVGASVRDMTAYLTAHLRPDDTPLAAAIDLATQIHAGSSTPMGLGWIQQGGVWWHNGGTGGSSAFCAFHRPTQTAVVLLANAGDQRSIDAAGMRVLTELVRR